MPRRIAATLALVSFALCLVAGAAAGNPFASVVVRALAAMAVMLFVGLVLGAMAQRMLDENVAREREAIPKGAVPEAGTADGSAR